MKLTTKFLLVFAIVILSSFIVVQTEASGNPTGNANRAASLIRAQVKGRCCLTGVTIWHINRAVGKSRGTPAWKSYNLAMFAYNRGYLVSAHNHLKAGNRKWNAWRY